MFGPQSVCSKGLIGPYHFLINWFHIVNVNQHSLDDRNFSLQHCYRMEWFKEQLKQKWILKTSWFMQDGAGGLSMIIRRVEQQKKFPSHGHHALQIVPADFWAPPNTEDNLIQSKKKPFTSFAFLKRTMTLTSFEFNKLRRQLLSSHSFDPCHRK